MKRSYEKSVFVKKQLFIILFVILLISFFSNIQWSEASYPSDSYYQTTEINDLLAYDKIAIVKIIDCKRSSDLEKIDQPNNNGEPLKTNTTGFIVCEVTEPIKNIQMGTYCFAYNVIIETEQEVLPFKVNSIYYIGLHEKNPYEHYTQAENSLNYQVDYDIWDFSEIVNKNKLLNHTNITTNMLKQTMNQRYKDEVFYAIKVTKKTNVFSAGHEAMPQNTYAYTNDILLMIDRPTTQYDDFTSGRAIECVYILYQDQEGLIDKKNIAQNKNGIIKMKIPSNFQLFPVYNSYYVYDSEKYDRKKIGIVRKGQIIAAKKYNENNLKIKTNTANNGYLSIKSISRNE